MKQNKKIEGSVAPMARLVEVTSFEQWVELCQGWGYNRNLDEVVFDWGALQVNCAEEWLEGAEARYELARLNRQAMAEYKMYDEVTVETKDRMDKADSEIIDALVDQLVYITVDTIKKGTALSTIKGMSVEIKEILEANPHLMLTVIDPAYSSWLVEGNVYLVYQATVACISALGYNYEGCLAECIKEISSRKGAYSAEAGKWVKVPTPESEKYTANYTRWQTSSDEV